MTTEGNNPKYSKWDSETGDSLRIASFSFLTIGFVAFVLVIRLILFEDRWVANIVTRFPKHPKQEDGAIKKDMKTDVYAFDLNSDSCEILDWNTNSWFKLLPVLWVMSFDCYFGKCHLSVDVNDDIYVLLWLKSPGVVRLKYYFSVVVSDVRKPRPRVSGSHDIVPGLLVIVFVCFWLTHRCQGHLSAYCLRASF